MSVQAMSWVIQNSKHKGNPFVILLMIANHARSDGTGAWPSLLTLAKESRVSRRTVWSCVNRLERSGEIAVQRRRGRNRTNWYDLPRVKPWLEKVQELHQLEGQKVQPEALKGASMLHLNHPKSNHPKKEAPQNSRRMYPRQFREEKVKTEAHTGLGPEAHMPTKYDKLIEELRAGKAEPTKENIMRAKNIVQQETSFTGEERQLAGQWLANQTEAKSA